MEALNAWNGPAWRGGDLWNAPREVRQYAAELRFGSRARADRLTTGLWQYVLVDGEYRTMGEGDCRAVLKAAGYWTRPDVGATS